MSGFKHWVVLLIFTQNKVTDRMLPKGTPISRGWESENVDHTQTCKDLSFKTLLIKTGRHHILPNSVVSILQIKENRN